MIAVKHDGLLMFSINAKKLFVVNVIDTSDEEFGE